MAFNYNTWATSWKRGGVFTWGNSWGQNQVDPAPDRTHPALKWFKPRQLPTVPNIKTYRRA